MVRKSVEIELKANAKAAKRELDKVAKAAKDVDDALEDGESAGKRMAKAIEASADDMIDEIDATKRAVDALDRALGDVDADPREVVAELKSIGLTADEIEADADELAAALRRVDDVKLSASKAGFDDVGQAVGSVRDETERTRDTMSGFVGGTVGELPLINEAMGPVAEGLGQLTEGALDGSVNMKSLVAAGLGMAAVAVVVKQVQGHFDKIKKIDAFNEAQVDAYTDALEDAATVVDAIAAKLEEAGGIFVNYFGDEQDMTAGFAALGVGVDEFSRLVADGETTIDEWGQALLDAGADSDTVTQAVHTLKKEADFLADAQDNAAASAEFFGDTARDTADKVNEVRDAWAGLKDDLDDRDSFLDIADAFDDVEQASNEAWLAAATGSEEAEREARDYERSVNDAKRRVIEYADEVGNIPESAVSEILALIDEGALSTAERRLAELERTRQARLDVRVNVVNPGTLLRFGAADAAQDRGGPIGSGRTALVAERRPEFVNGQLVTSPTLVDGPASVTSGRQTAGMIGAAPAGGNTYVTVTAPAGIDLDWLQRQQYRRTGRPA